MKDFLTFFVFVVLIPALIGFGLMFLVETFFYVIIAVLATITLITLFKSFKADQARLRTSS